MRGVQSLLGDAVVRKGMVSVFDQAVVSGTSFVTSVLIGRLCSRAELGIYYLALSIVLFVRGVQEQIVSAPYSIYCHRKRGGRLAGYTGSTLAHQAVLAILTVLCLLAVAFVGLAGYDFAGLSTAIWALLGAIPFLLLRDHIRHLSFSRFKLRTVVAFDVAVAVVQIGGLLLLAWWGALTVFSAYVVMGIACAVACLAWCISGVERVEIRRHRLLPDWLHNWTFGRWALASQLVASSAQYVLPWFIAALRGAAQTGVLAACNTLVGLANAFIMGLSNFLSPKAAHAYAEGGVKELKRVLWKTAALFGVSVGGFCLVTLLAGDWLAVLIYGDKYAGAGPIIAVLAFAMLANAASITAGNGLWAMEKPSANFGADVCALIVTAVAAIVLLPMFGVLGAAVATLIGNAVDAVIRTIVLSRMLRRVRG